MAGHVLRVRVRYGETDQMGVVYHANYLLYFEMARTELLREAGIAYADLEKGGCLLVVVAVDLRYRSGARYDEMIEVTTLVDDIGKYRVRFSYAVRGEDGRLCAEGHTELAAVDRDRKLCRLPEDVVERLHRPI